jgi:NAD(P)-dependent dehydrogenase (short-subunit alcohol dehydrogenase family)
VVKAGGQAIGIEADVSDPSSVDKAFKTIEEALPGRQLVAAIYNLNTGFGIKPFLDLKPEEFRFAVGGVAYVIIT